MRRLAAVLLVSALGLLTGCGSTPKRDLEFDRLHASLLALAADPELGKLALAERSLADAAVRRLDASAINAKEHAHWAYVAERRVDIAYIAAQTARETERLAAHEREHASLLLAASRRETAAMREELERQRRQDLLREEDAQRVVAGSPATAPAIAAAAPAPTSPGGDPASALLQRLQSVTPEPAALGAQITLEDLTFEAGTANLVAQAGVALDRVVAFVATDPKRAIRIDGYTDATGSADANLVLSQRRAETLRDALVARGVAAARFQVFGHGAAMPIASNDNAEGRATNRRVVVTLLAR